MPAVESEGEHGGGRRGWEGVEREIKRERFMSRFLA
jgi:hypothetical protein